MGRVTRVLKAPSRAVIVPSGLPATLSRRRPRSYIEWNTLRQWNRLPGWEDDPPGFLLRNLREDAGWTQKALAQCLGCSQQAIAQAERWEANPTIKFIKEWALALGRDLVLEFPRQRASSGKRDIPHRSGG